MTVPKAAAKDKLHGAGVQAGVRARVGAAPNRARRAAVRRASGRLQGAPKEPLDVRRGRAEVQNGAAVPKSALEARRVNGPARMQGARQAELRALAPKNRLPGREEAHGAEPPSCGKDMRTTPGTGLG